MPINFDSSKSYNDNYDGANISISKKTRTRTIDNRRDQLTLDQIAKSTSSFREDYIPPVDNPQLGIPDPNAEKNTPKTAPSPQNAFLKKTQTLIAKLTPEQLSAFHGAAKEEVQAQLLFALNHPGVPVDGNIQSLINQLKNQAELATKSQLKLPASWQPSTPNTQKADKAITDFANATFENLVYSQLPEDEANNLIFQYYHPEFANEADSSKLAAFKNKAYQETAVKEGLPDGWKIKSDSSAYDAMVNAAYDEAFTRNLNSNPDLSSKEKAQLETLHQFPDADVPDKAKLQKLLSQLENEAVKDTAKEFNLPKEFKPGTNFKEYASILLGEYQSKFEGEVKNQQPPLSRAQQNKLLATGGVNPKNLSPELEALFNQIKEKTADDVAEMYGLPKNWLKTNKDKAAVELEGQSEEVNEEADQPQAGGTKGSKKSKSTEGENIGLDALSGVVRKKLSRKSLNETQKLEGVSPVFLNKNHQGALNAIKFYEDGTRIFDSWITKLSSLQGGEESNGDRFNLSSDWMLAGDFTFAVTKALDKVRKSVYQMQFSEAKMSKLTSIMTIDNQKTQTLINEAVRKNAQAQAKSEEKKNVFAAMENAPGIAGIFGKAFASWLKLQFWVLDTILGGAISSICSACGCQSLSANPLEMLGLISHEAAEEMDKILQIVIMVVQIVIEILLAQPQLVAASIAAITKTAGSLAAKVALKTAVKQVVKNAVEVGIKEAVSEAAEALGKEAIKEIASQIATKAGQALSKTAQKNLAKAIEKGLTKNAEKIIKRAAKEAEKLIEKYGDDAIIQAKNSLDDVTKNVMKQASDIGADEVIKKGLSSSLKGFDKFKFNAANYARDLGDMLVSKASQIKDAFLNIGKKIKGMARNQVKSWAELSAKVGDTAGYARHDKWVKAIGESLYTEAEIGRMVGRSSVNARMAITGVTTVSKAYQAASFVSDVATGSLQIASGVVSGMKSLNMARLKLEMGRYEASLAELDANLKIMKQLQRALLDSLSNLAGWINDVNKQEGDFYKKSQIHFIAA